VFRTLLSLTTGLALLAGSSVLTQGTASALGVADVSAAHAGGKIKRIKIKKKSVGTPCCVVVGDTRYGHGPKKPSRSGLPGGSDDTVTGVITQPGTTNLVAKIALKPTRSKARFDQELGAEVAVASVSLPTVTTETLTVEAGDVFSDVTAKDGTVVRVRLTDSGRLITVVRNTDAAWDPQLAHDYLEKAMVTPKGGEAVAVDVADYDITTRWRADTADSSLGRGVTLDKDGYYVIGDERLETVQLALTWADSGATFETLSDTVPVPPSESSSVGLVRVNDTRDGIARVRAITEAGAKPTLGVYVEDAAGKPLVDALLTSPRFTVQAFVSEPIAFEGGEDAGGVTYLVVLDAYDATGGLVGAQREVEITIPDADERKAFDPVRVDDGIAVAVSRFDGRVRLTAAYEGAPTVDSVVLQFQEPYEGPAPLEPTLEVDQASTFQDWRVVGTELLPESTLSVEVDLAEAGGTVDLISSTATESGTVYRTSATCDDPVCARHVPALIPLLKPAKGTK